MPLRPGHMTSVKLEFPAGDIRRVRLASSPLSLAELQPHVRGGALTHIDDEGDACLITCSAELQEAARLAADAGKTLRVLVSPAPGADAPAPAPVRDAEPPATLDFVLNGEPVHVDDPDPRMSLLDYLRGVAGLTGTKGSCRQGGCGACTVVMKTGASGPALAVNACLRPLCSLDGRQIVTTEGLGNARDG